MKKSPRVRRFALYKGFANTKPNRIKHADAPKGSEAKPERPSSKKVADIPNPGWEVSRRFRQFVELHDQLLQIYPSRLPELPKKRMRSNNSEVARKRQTKLRIYIEQLLKMDIKSPLLYDFLGIPT